MLLNKVTHSWGFPITGLRFLLTVLLLLGIFFRFVNIDRKVYWIDEAFTSIRVSGYTEDEIVKNLSNAHIIRIDELQKYQRPNREKGLIDTIKSLQVEDPHHPPLYYVMARFWAQVFGSSVAAMRSLPALISLLALPCIYWLCMELSESPLIAWIAVALVAISPFHVLYAQEARPYSLWTVTILLSSAALLRARRLKTKASWGIYAVTLVASFYTFLFSGLVAVGHGIYIATIERFRLTKTLIAYLAATFLSVIAFFPWLWVLITNLSQAKSATDWAVTAKLSLWQLFFSWAETLRLVIFDLKGDLLDSSIYRLFLKAGDLLVLALVGYSLYFLWRKTPKRIWLLIWTLTGVTALVLILPDLFVGGFRSLVPRYLIPCYLGVQLAIAYLLATKLTDISSNNQPKKLWSLIMVVVFSGSVLSCLISFQSDVAWSKDLGKNIPAVARILNQATSPLLIGSPSVTQLLSLSYSVGAKLHLLVEPQCRIDCVDYKPDDKTHLPKIPKRFSDVFLFKDGSYEKWLHLLEKEPIYTLKPIVSKSKEILLWRVERR
jgi:uncharacterized membrane protein